MKKRRSIFLCLCVLLLTSTLAFAKAELNFSDRKKKYEVKENKLSSELASLRNPGRWRKITDRRSQEEKNVEIEVVQKLFNIAKEKREGLREGETKEQRKERETGIKNRIISETAEIIRNAKTDELIKTNNLRGAIVNRIALARIIVESKRSIETTKKREKLRLENEIGQLEKKRKGAYNQKRNLNIVTQDLETILKEVRSAQGQLKQAESDLSLVGLTLESEEEQISRRKSFYENSQNVDGEFQTESSAFTSKVEDFKNAKEKVAVIEKVNSQIEGRKSIYEKAKIIANKPTATPSPALSEPAASEPAARDAAGAGKGDGSSDASGEETHKATPTLARKEIKVEVREGNSIYVRSDKKIKKERIIIEPRIDMSEIRNIEVRGREVFLHEERYKDGKIEIEGYGEFGLLPELKKGNETTLARLYDRVLEGRERKEEGEVDGKGVREEKGRILFEKIGHLCVKEAYELIRKEVRGMSLIPNIVMSVGSDEERKYVYKNIGEKEEEEKNKVWIEGINEIKNYREDEQSIGKYSDNKVGAIVGYGKEIGEGKYVGMYMKGSKHEIKQGAGNSGEVVNVGLGISGMYENKVEIKWLAHVGMNKCKTEREWEEGKVKGEFSMGEIGIDVEGGLKVRSKLLGIVKPYIGIGARKSSYGKIEEKGKLVNVNIEEGSYERCVGRIGVEGSREISKKVEVVGRVEYEKVIKGERGEVRLEGTRDKALGVKEGKDKVGINVEGRYKVSKDLGISAGLNGYKAEGYNEVGVNVGGWFKF